MQFERHQTLFLLWHVAFLIPLEEKQRGSWFMYKMIMNHLSIMNKQSKVREVSVREDTRHSFAGLPLEVVP